ncbi:hypothetical protein J5069_02975 [Candidatus Symbiopectobacterium sp. NZEC127]|uniref:hypothetical protein n=1 Tax=Candidatus Symbiopectobacterium sp. NZEC127 TaxID=2820472 RepID=UPI0022263C40|nr:hypothetical protein [Candidatus Symbiopectobacterium sp. NZEC127]MCW2484854.1 hypothetical protein [Candidatus Symbiopectobacterium sp. NZEC127]
MSIKPLLFMSFFALTACSTTKVVDTFTGTPGTAGMAYCVRDQWVSDSLVNHYPSGAIRIMEDRSGVGSYYVYDDKGEEMVRAKGTIGYWPGQKPSDIEVNFYMPQDKSMTARATRRLALSKQCAAIPTKEREDKYLPSVICTDKTACSFRRGI